ncbi:MAG: helix-turn-helix transcriptional regulator [Fibrobacteres bacterium]|nr:helix-turn-helix transcriptional regulator [Fibrobacterota bacterium]
MNKKTFLILLLLTSFVVSSEVGPFIETFEYGKTYTASSINIGDTTILLTNSETMNEWPDSFGLSLVENTDIGRRDYFSYKVKRKNQLFGVTGIDFNQRAESEIVCNGHKKWYEPSKILKGTNDTNSAIFGSFGFRSNPDQYYKLEKKIDNDSSIYVRFYISIDSLLANNKNEITKTLIHALSPGGFLRIYLETDTEKKSTGLLFAIEDDILKKKESEKVQFQKQLLIHNVYCVEYLLKLDNIKESYTCTAWINGSLLFETSAPYYIKMKKHHFYAVLFGALSYEPYGNSIFRIDDIAYSTARTGPLSLNPEMSLVKNERGNRSIIMNNEDSSYESIQLQISDKGEWRFPLLTQKSEAPIFRISLRYFPFDSDSMYYRVKAKQKNCDWSHWSKPLKFDNFNKGRLTTPVINDIIISEENLMEPETLLISNKWYDITVNVDDSAGFENVYYCHLLFHHESQPVFNVTDRGAPFDPELNYMVSYSKSNVNGKDVIYTLEEPGSEITRQVCSSCSLYVDCTKPCAVSDSVNKTLKTNFRHLQEAREGVWILDGVLFNKQENYSKSFRKRFYVKRADVEKRHGSPLWLILPIVLVSGIIFWTRKRKRIIVQDPRISAAVKFIKENLSKKISVEMVAEHIRMSEGWLITNFKKETGTGIPNFVNELRVEKAKELIEKGERNIAEVGYMAGFSDPAYFNRIFKAVTGKSPGEYLKSIKT